MIGVPELLGQFRHSRRWTREFVEAMPESLFDWAPPGSGFTCGGMVRHLIQAEVFWRRLLERAVAGEAYDPFGLPGERDERLRRFAPINVDASRDERLGGSFESCLAAWTKVQEQTEAFLSGLDAESLTGTTVRHPLTGLEGPLWRMVLVMIEHEAHHRGQLSAWLKSRGLEHPEGLWS